MTAASAQSAAPGMGNVEPHGPVKRAKSRPVLWRDPKLKRAWKHLAHGLTVREVAARMEIGKTAL